MKDVLSKEEIENIKKEYVAGDSIGNLAQRYYVSKPCITYWLKKANIQIRPRGGNNNPTGKTGEVWR